MERLKNLRKYQANKFSKEPQCACVLFPQWNYLYKIDNTEFQRSLINTSQNREDLQHYLQVSGDVEQGI